MQTIIIVLNPTKLQNFYLDLCYHISYRIEEVSNGIIQDNGYHYISNKEDESEPSLLGICLKTESAKENWPIIMKLFQDEKFIGNDLSMSAEIFISENDTENIENCTLVFPK
ncbi:MAG: hypothetical protein K2G20_11155 [Lachnospiraceae bacterium]|nr:hypothetical protein [Lachnospiraceae bacterium]